MSNKHYEMPTNTYWASKGTLQKVGDKLQEMLPNYGEVPSKHRNPKLERLRKAINYYYDLYNNGLCNRSRGFSKFFGLPALYNYQYINGKFDTCLFWDLEEKMDEIILAAAKEQLSWRDVANAEAFIRTKEKAKAV